MYRNVLAVVALAGALASGCASVSGRDRMGRGDGATLILENNRYADADIFVIPENGIARRIGMVVGHTTGRLHLPADLWMGSSAVQLRIVCRQIGDGANSCNDRQVVHRGDEFQVETRP